MKSIIKSIASFSVNLGLKILPNGTLSAIIAAFLTDAMQKAVKDKEKCAKVSDACAASGEAFSYTANAIKDCTITEEEVDGIADRVRVAVEKIEEAAR